MRNKIFVWKLATLTARGFLSPLMALAVLAAASSVRAGTLTVTTLSDSGPGSLRQAIADTSPGDTITFSVKGTITLTSGALMIAKNLDIEGPGPNKLKISGNHASRVFVIASPDPTSPPKITLAGMTITSGLADGSSPFMPSVGGGVLNFASLTLSHDVVSNNQALGDKSQAPFGPFGLYGHGGGGGVENLGTLAITDSSFLGNLAQGADGTSGYLPGIGGGGALANLGDAHVTGSQFTGNVAQGGSLCSGFFAGACIGGAIQNIGAMSIATSTFSQNQAIGGSDNVGPASGNAYSGAIQTESFFGPASLDLCDSQFDHNQAIGGNENTGDSYPSQALGGAVHFNQNPVGPVSGTVSGCTLEHNEALGGAGVAGAEGGYGMCGGLDAEGPSNVTVRNCRIEHNRALGGPGGLGGNGGIGGGGGLRSGDGATLTVINTIVAHNHAQGGAGGPGGNGGLGWAGGLLDFYNATLALTGAIITDNLAIGGEAGDGGSSGLGIGGGVGMYPPVTFTFDPTTVIEKNHATTSNDNL
jgi:hypothetical protein